MSIFFHGLSGNEIRYFLKLHPTFISKQENEQQ